MAQGSALTYFNNRSIFNPILVKGFWPAPISALDFVYLGTITGGDIALMTINSNINEPFVLAFTYGLRTTAPRILPGNLLMGGITLSIIELDFKNNGMIMPGNVQVWGAYTNTTATAGQIAITTAGI
jgi:hypothetical protein